MSVERVITCVIGVLLVLYMIGCGMINNFNIGIYIPILIGAIIAMWSFMPNNRVIRILKIIFAVALCIYILFMIFIGVMGQTNSAEFDEDAVIVLGCGLHGRVPSGNLVDRLNKAVDYFNKNSDAVIVVSGGQGPQEDCTEAEAMCDYLVEMGIPKNSIIMEDKATSTNENYQFSKAILDEKFEGEYKIVYITNSFHSYRAGKLAELNGFSEPKSYNARTKAASLIPNYCREALAVIQLWIFKK